MLHTEYYVETRLLRQFGRLKEEEIAVLMHRQGWRVGIAEASRKESIL